MLKPGNLEFVVYSSKLNLKLNLNVNLYEGHNSQLFTTIINARSLYFV